MINFVLIPGAFHGAWCFESVVALLRQGGYRAVAVDLPGTGQAGNPAAATRAAWIEQVVAILAGADGPAVLVGHSRGGIVTSLVAEHAPELVALGVYLSAALLPSGASPIRGLLGAQGLGDLAVIPDHLAVPPFALARDVLYHQAGDADARRAYARLAPEPTAPLLDDLVLTEKFDRVPRAYIECLEDKAVDIALQRSMHRRLACAIVRSLPSDHSPFLSHDRLLADVLVEVAQSAGLAP